MSRSQRRVNQFGHLGGLDAKARAAHAAAMGRFRRKIEAGGTWWAQDRRGEWHRWDAASGDWVRSDEPPPVHEAAEQQRGGRPWGWRFSRRSSSSGVDLGFSIGPEAPDAEPSVYRGQVDTTLIRETGGDATVRHMTVPLRRRWPSSPRQGARLFGLLAVVLCPIAVDQKDDFALAVCVGIALVLLGAWAFTTDTKRYWRDFPHKLQEPPWQNYDGPETFPDRITRPARATIALCLATPLFGLWWALDPTPSQALTALVPAGIVAVLAYENPLRPINWPVKIAIAMAVVVTVGVGGLVVLFPSSGSNGGLIVLTSAATIGAVTYAFLQLVAVLRRTDKMITRS